MSKYFTLKGKPWEYKGAVNVEDCTSAEEVIIKARLNFNVAKCPLYACMDIKTDGNDEELDNLSKIGKQSDAHIHGKNIYRECPNAWGTYRDDYNIPLGIVKSRYTVVQNQAAFKFFNDAIKHGNVKWQTAGAFGMGERIFVSAKLPKGYMVKGKDPLENYIIFTNSHDGSGGVKILFSPIRVICQNTLNAAIRGATNYVSFRHTASVHSNIQTAHTILGIALDKAKEFGEYCDMLANIKVTDEDVMKYICDVNLTDDEDFALRQFGYTPKHLCYRVGLAAEAAKISIKKLNVISNQWEYYNDGFGQDLIAGTAWGAYNAVTGYYANIDNGVGEKYLDSMLYGDKSNKLANALAMAESIN